MKIFQYSSRFLQRLKFSYGLLDAITIVVNVIGVVNLKI